MKCRGNRVLVGNWQTPERRGEEMTAGNTGIVGPRGEDERKGGRSARKATGALWGGKSCGLPVANARLVVRRAERRGPCGGRG